MGAANIDPRKKSTGQLVDELGQEFEKLAKELDDWKKQRAAIEKKFDMAAMTCCQKIASVDCPSEADKDLVKLATELTQKFKQKTAALKSYASIDGDVEYNKSANRL